MTEGHIPLSLLSREAKALAGRHVLTYREAHYRVLDGRIPAEKGAGGQWMIPRAALPSIVAAFSRAPAPAVVAA